MYRWLFKDGEVTLIDSMVTAATVGQSFYQLCSWLTVDGADFCPFTFVRAYVATPGLHRPTL